jgi:hypothetical protein
MALSQLQLQLRGALAQLARLTATGVSLGPNGGKPLLECSRIRSHSCVCRFRLGGIPFALPEALKSCL